VTSANCVAHWDEVEARRPQRRGLGGAWTNLGSAAGSVTVGVHRIQLDAGEVSTPAHVHGADEEIFFVLDGSGLSWQDGRTYAVRAGDCLVHRPRAEAHTLRAGDDGLDVLIYGMRVPLQIGDLPRADVAWISGTWTDAGTGEHPWAREVAAGEPEVGEPEPRPSNIVNREDVEWDDWVPGGDFGITSAYLAQPAGATKTGLNIDRLHPGKRNGPRHIHSAEEELFVVLEGDGWFIDGDEEHPVRKGHVIARPAGGRVGHAFRGGDDGMEVLLYGTRDPNDICFYPDSNKVFFRGLGVITRIEQLDYLDGEL
jgi:uncharacterized cupin superfamily protein